MCSFRTSEVKETKDIATVASIPTWYHCGNSASGPNKQRVPPFYNPFHRNPLFAGGEYCVYTELLKLSQHFHPSVMLFANKILQGETVKYPGDPLQDFALPRFLDRFVFKNPKKIEEESASSSKFSRTKSYAPKGIRSLRVDSANYLNEDESRIPVEELFMYRYLHKKMSEGVKKEVKEEDDDASSVASEEFNQYLEEMIGDNKGEIDFAEEIGKHASSKREDSDEENEEDNEKNTAEVHESDEESDISQEENNENLDDDEDDILNDEDLDDDAEDIVFDDSESDIELDVSDEEPTLNGKKRHKLGMKVTKKRGADENPFVLAEEFAEMLDNAGAARLKMSGSSALSNRDNAGEKQLKWETARDYWVKKGDKQSKKSYGAKRKWAGHQNKSSKRRK